MTTITNLDTAVASGPGRGNAASIASWQRPNDTTAYGVGDIISNSSAAAAAIEFPNCGRSGRITAIHVNMEELDTVDLQFWLFDREPTNQLDNAGLALVLADAPKILHRVNLADSGKASGGTGIVWYDAVLAMPIPYVSDSGKLYGLLRSLSAFTPVAQSKYLIRLGLERD